MKEIDLTTWERKSHYEWFGKFATPTFALDVRMDVTKFLAYCKKQKISSFAAMMYCVCKCINENKSFRYRILNGKVYEIPYANTAYTVAVNDYFVNTRENTNVDLFTFCKSVHDKQRAMADSSYVQETYNDTAIIDDIYCSCVPWVDFSSACQPIPDNMPESSSIPRVCWGRYTKERGRIKVTVNITASHALCDGKDMAEVFNNLQELFNNPKKHLGETSK